MDFQCNEALKKKLAAQSTPNPKKPLQARIHQGRELCPTTALMASTSNDLNDMLDSQPAVKVIAVPRG